MSELKTKYKHIEFVVNANEWICIAHSTQAKLGTIQFHRYWKTHVYLPENSLYSPDCLRDIADFLEQLNKKKKEQNNNG
jgi:outer membrane PBP1 activator LpoA protein